MKRDEVRKVLYTAVAEASDISRIFTGNVGSTSAEMLNRLIAVFSLEPLSENFNMTTTMPLSRYAARLFAFKAEVSVLKQLIFGQGLMHSTFRGLLFEVLLIKQLKHGLSMTYKGKQSPVRWGACTVVSLTKMPPRLDQLAEGRTCVQLLYELQGGYDG
eukprot:751498-Hanusia_phi.AAC.1